MMNTVIHNKQSIYTFKKPFKKINNHAHIRLINGLGDKMLDLTGFFIICKFLNYTPSISFEQYRKFQWGQNYYDLRLFQFNQFLISDKPCPFFLKQSHPSVSLSPFEVFKFISTIYPNITFEQISNQFIHVSKQLIKPSPMILSNIPPGIENAYGIHLRKSDKIRNVQHNVRHISSSSEFDILTHHLLEDVKKIISEEDQPTFLIVSEDNEWKQEISERVLSLSDKSIQLIQIEYNNPNQYTNYNSVLDMFCLSKCKEILQGVKYSTFSMVASLIGNRKIRNYAHHLENYDICLIHNWSSVLNINHQPRNFNKIKHHQTSKHIEPIKTNMLTRFT